MVKDTLSAVAGALLGLLLLLRIIDGSARSLVQGWYEPVLLASAVLLLALASFVAARSLRSSARMSMRLRPASILTAGLIVVPIGVGLALTPEPLGSANLDRGGSSTQFSLTAANADPAQRNLYQWAYEFSTAPPETLIGDPVDLVAFVYRGKDTPSDRFLAARFVVACCVADATGYVLPIQWRDAPSLENDEWVRIKGQVAPGSEGDLVVLAASVEPIGVPANPYIYP